MTANKYLLQIRDLEIRIDRLTDAIKQRPLPGISGTDFKAPRVDSYPGDKIGSYAAWHSDLSQDLYEKLAAYKKLRNEAIQRINRLENGDQVDILMRRYVLYQTWGRIADETNYTKRHVFRLRNQALTAFEEVNYDLFCDDERET